MQFTKKTLAAIDLKTEGFIWNDDMPGFGIRVRGGSGRYVIQYRIGAKQRRESLGDVRKITLESAIDIAQKKFAQVTLGIDPAGEKQQKRAEEKAVKLTFETVAKQYIAAKIKLIAEDKYRKSTLVQLQLHLGTHWATFNDLPIEGIDRKLVATRLNHLESNNGEIAASRARSNLNALFVWSMKKGLVEHNPVVATFDPGENAVSRDRVLSDAELVAVWKSCDADDFGRIVRLLVLTGCRREEIGSLRYSEIDFEMGTITIPTTRTKNRREHCLPLPPLGMDILREVPKRDGHDCLFGGGEAGYNAWSYSSVALRERVTLAMGKPPVRYRLHDLRRTMRTNLGKIGVPPHVAEIIINHRKGGVEAVYDRFRYDTEIKAGLAKWADYVLALTEGRPVAGLAKWADYVAAFEEGKISNVTTLRAA